MKISRRVWIVGQHTTEMNLRGQQYYETNFLQALKLARQWLARPVKHLEVSRDGIPTKSVHMKLHVAASNNYLCSLLQ